MVGISPAASSPMYSSTALGDKQFTMSMWNTTMGAATAEFAWNQKKWKVGYVVTDTFIDYTKSLSRYFIIHFKKLGGTILFEDAYVQGAQDFSAQLARLKAAKKPFTAPRISTRPSCCFCMISKFGFSMCIKKYSGGMKRRVNIGVGLLHKPRLLFMDEPTVRYHLMKAPNRTSGGWRTIGP
jgi:ATPase subunit of ABC transporter with duplicated ATPase domains